MQYILVEDINMSKTYYKFIGEDMTNHNLTYKLGLNVDPNPFSPILRCRGGIFFIDKKHTAGFTDYDPYFCEIKIPKGESIVAVDDELYKSHSVIIKKIYDLRKIEDIKELLSKGFEFDWYMISYYQALSEDFIREFADKVNWYQISRHQTLSEPFIREFADKVDWRHISSSQTLSEPFIRDFADKIDWYWISAKYWSYSKSFKKEFADKLKTCTPPVFLF
jgi:hypothetical protein